MKRLLIAFLITFGVIGQVKAQSTNFGITPTGVTQTMSVTSVSSTITLNTTPGNTVLIQNTGTKTAYIKGGATATTNDFPLQGGWGIVLNYPPGQTVAAITGGSDTTTLLVTKGLGSTALTGGGSGTGGGTVTANQGTKGTNAQAWWMQIGDGTNGPAKVQVGNAAATTDIALTVSDPNVLAAVNAAIPAGANLIGKVGIDQTTPNTTNHVSQNPYPDGSVPYTATATGTTGATTATLTGASSVTTYLCGFSIRANATAAATGNATVTGTITATLNFTQWTAPNASGLGVTEEVFSPCIPASGTNQSIAVISAAPGTGGVVSVTAWGYKL